MNLLPPEFSGWVVAGMLAVSFVASFLTAAAGIGGGVLMLATIASAVPPAAIIPVHGVIQIGSCAGRAWLMRPHVERGVLAWFAAGTVVGVLVGGSVYAVLHPDTLRLILGVFILYSVWGPKLARMTLRDAAFAPVGAVTGLITMFIGGTGPFVASFVNPGRFGKEGTVATHAACMTTQHGLKIAVIGALGFAFGPWLVFLAAMIAAGFAGTFVGRSVLLRLPERVFSLTYKLVLTTLALRLLWSARDTLGG